MNAISAISGNGFELQTPSEKRDEMREEFEDLKRFRQEQKRLKEIETNG